MISIFLCLRKRHFMAMHFCFCLNLSLTRASHRRDHADIKKSFIKKAIRFTSGPSLSRSNVSALAIVILCKTDLFAFKRADCSEYICNAFVNDDIASNKKALRFFFRHLVIPRITRSALSGFSCLACYAFRIEVWPNHTNKLF